VHRPRQSLYIDRAKGPRLNTTYALTFAAFLVTRGRVLSFFIPAPDRRTAPSAADAALPVGSA